MFIQFQHMLYLNSFNPKSIPKLYRIHDQILLSSETAFELILEGLGNLKIIKTIFPSLTDFVFDGQGPTF